MRRLLIVSPHFPPTNAPDMQRARQSLPYFADNGWEVEVLAVDPQDANAPQDPLLGGGLPANLPVHRVRALPLALGRILGARSLGPRARFALGRAGDRLLSGSRFDLVFFTTTQFIVLTLGPRWKHRHGVPYVLDWQDPWVNDFYDRPGAGPAPGGWKYRLAAWQARRHEGPCVRNAAGLVATSPRYLEQLAARYPWFHRIPAATMPFGVEPSDFGLADRLQAEAALRRDQGCHHFAYVGAMTSGMEPALDALFAALSRWRRESPGEVQRLRFHFIGTSYDPSRRSPQRALALATKWGLADIVREQTARVGYLASLRTMREADALMVLGSADEGYSPSKLAVLIHARKPVLGLLPSGSPLQARLQQMGIRWCLVQGDPLYQEKMRHSMSAPLPAPPDSAPAEHLTAAATTAELCRFFSTAIASPAGQPPLSAGRASPVDTEGNPSNP